MSRRTLSPVGQFTKWVVIPLLLAATGYYVAAPRLSGSPFASELAVPQIEQETSGTTEENASNVPPPDVDVSVQPASRRVEPREEPRRRRAPRKKPSAPPAEKPKPVEDAEPAPVVEPDPQPVEPPDEGGSGGAGGGETSGGTDGGTGDNGGSGGTNGR